MKRNFLLGKFWHPDHVMDALHKLREMGVTAHDVFSPFPIHNIDPLLNIKRTRLLIATFIYGAVGFITAVGMISMIYGVVWGMDIGGKPTLPFPDYVPITFELTVLFAAHGTILTFFVVSQYWPGKKAILMDDRQTDDVFVVAINEHDVDAKQVDDINRIMLEAGAYEIGQKAV